MKKLPNYIFSVWVLKLICTGSLFAQGLPVKSTRTIAFTTNEGSYMSLDISPDGKTLLFDLLGNIYSLPVTGGKANQLTRGMALNIRPSWSHNGKKIAYLSDASGSYHFTISNIEQSFHTVLGGSENELEPGHIAHNAPIWSPDDHFLIANQKAFGVGGGFISLDSLVPTIDGYNKRIEGFSKDGQIAYISNDTLSLYSFDAKSKQKKLLLSKRQLGIFKGYPIFAISDDNHWISYVSTAGSQKALMIINLFNNDRRILVSHLLRQDTTRGTGGDVGRFCFSPDSKAIFISYGGKIHRIDAETGRDDIIPFTADVKFDCGPFNYNQYTISGKSANAKYIRYVSERADCKQLVFEALNRIYVMGLPNGKPTVLVNQPLNQFEPAYSPDGQWITYTSWSDSSGGALWKVRVDGRHPEQLTKAVGQYRYPCWSPDGKYLAVIKGPAQLLGSKYGAQMYANGWYADNRLGELELISADGKAIRKLKDTVPLTNSLSFSADGLSVIFSPKYSSGYNFLQPQPNIVSADLNGKDIDTLATGAEMTRFAQKSLSPDGRYAVCAVLEDIFLMPVLKLNGPVNLSSNGKFPAFVESSKLASAIRFAKGVDPHWEDNGKMLAWNYANHFYRINPDKIIESAEKISQSGGKSEDEGFYYCPIKPVEDIPLSVAIPYNHATGMVALINARIVTMKDDQVIEGGTILIKDGRIEFAGPASEVKIPAGSISFDLKDSTIIPGFVDTHLHLREPTEIFPQQYWMYLINLAYGVTTARDPAANFGQYGYAELLTSGQMIGPRLFTAGVGVLPQIIPNKDSVSDYQTVVEKRAEMGSIVVKNYFVGKTRIESEQLDRACYLAGINVTNEGARDKMIDLGMIKDGSSGIEHNYKWGDAYKDIISVFAESGIWFTPTAHTLVGDDLNAEGYFDYKYWHTPDAKLNRFMFSDSGLYKRIGNIAPLLEKLINLQPKDTLGPNFLPNARVDARIFHAGGRIAVGSHGNDQGIGFHNELWALQSGGLTNMEALQAATINGAGALGLQKDIGSIEPGKIADLVILNKNPLDDIHNSREIRYVMKDGILYDGDTLDEIWPEKKKCPEWKMRAVLQPKRN